MSTSYCKRIFCLWLCKRKYENGTENGRPLHKFEPEFAPVEAKVDFAGPTPPELTADTLMAYLHKHPGP